MKKEERGDTGRPLVISYLTLRKAIGVLGIALPFALAFGGLWLHGVELQNSVSSYYRTEMRDVFVGTLCAIAVFLMAYNGYDPIDNVIGKLASLFAIGTALLPVAPDRDPSPHEVLIGNIHLFSAALFFLALAIFSLFLFTQTDPQKKKTQKKQQRNAVYIACGCLILVGLVLIAVIGLLPDGTLTELKKGHPIFWLESMMVVAFGFSWLTKGEAILQD